MVLPIVIRHLLPIRAEMFLEQRVNDDLFTSRVSRDLPHQLVGPSRLLVEASRFSILVVIRENLVGTVKLVTVAGDVGGKANWTRHIWGRCV